MLSVSGSYMLTTELSPLRKSGWRPVVINTSSYMHHFAKVKDLDSLRTTIIQDWPIIIPNFIPSGWHVYLAETSFKRFKYYHQFNTIGNWFQLAEYNDSVMKKLKVPLWTPWWNLSPDLDQGIRKQAIISAYQRKSGNWLATILMKENRYLKGYTTQKLMDYCQEKGQNV